MRRERVVHYHVMVHTQWSDSGHVVFSDSGMLTHSFRFDDNSSTSKVLFTWKYWFPTDVLDR